MKAISLMPHTSNVSLVDIPEPGITATDQVKIKVWQVGICGTDREEISGGRADAPKGKDQLIIGHEMFGQVIDAGEDVIKVKKGDYGAFMVRRGCGKCIACKHERSDMCFTGGYTERGIKGADGFQCEYVVDYERYLVKIPEVIKEIAVLTEPMSVATKAIDEALTIQQARFKDFKAGTNWLEGKKALVAGLGPIGLMAAFALRLEGAHVFGMDILDAKSIRPQILEQIGGKYVDSRKVKVTDLDNTCGESDFIFEATGIAKLQVELIDALAFNGVLVETGIARGDRPLTISAGNAMKQLVLKNQVILGSVNASMQHYEKAVNYLVSGLTQWPDAIKRIITEKVSFKNFKRAFDSHSENEIKVVMEWCT